MAHRLLASAVLSLVTLSIGRTAAAQHTVAPAGHVPAEHTCARRSRPSDCIGTDSAERRRLARATYAIPLYGDGTHLVVNGTLNSVLSGLMLVDTGASYCVLTRAAAHSLGLTPTARSTVPVSTANGRVVADLVRLTRWRSTMHASGESMPSSSTQWTLRSSVSSASASSTISVTPWITRGERSNSSGNLVDSRDVRPREPRTASRRTSLPPV